MVDTNRPRCLSLVGVSVRFGDGAPTTTSMTPQHVCLPTSTNALISMRIVNRTRSDTRGCAKESFGFSRLVFRTWCLALGTCLYCCLPSLKHNHLRRTHAACAHTNPRQSDGEAMLRRRRAPSPERVSPTEGREDWEYQVQGLERE